MGILLSRRTLTLDIETRPAVAYLWGPKEEWLPLPRLIDPGGVICFAARWNDTKKILFHSDWDDTHDGMVRAAWDLLSEADDVVTFNGDNFDLPWLGREFRNLRLGPPDSYKSVDLIKTEKKYFRDFSRKLQHIAEQLSVGSKVEHEGFPLWVKCIQGDPKAQKRMKRYNKGDITITDKVLQEFKPWLTTTSNANLFGGDGCPVCGGKVQKRGFKAVGLAIYQTYRCVEPDCRKQCTDGKAVDRVKMRAIG